jgi:hypothetical protein
MEQGFSPLAQPLSQPPTPFGSANYIDISSFVNSKSRLGKAILAGFP